MQHPGQHQVLDEAGRAEHLIGKVQPRHRFSCQRLRTRQSRVRKAVGVDIQINLHSQIGVAGEQALGPEKLPATNCDACRLQRFAVREMSDGDRANLRRDLTQRAAALLD